MGEQFEGGFAGNRKKEIGIQADRIENSLVGCHLFDARAIFASRLLLGIVDPAANLGSNPHEVEEAFEVPLTFFDGFRLNH